MTLDDDDLTQIAAIARDILAETLGDAAMRLEAVRVNSLMAENLSLKLQVLALQQRLEQMEQRRHDHQQH